MRKKLNVFIISIVSIVLSIAIVKGLTSRYGYLINSESFAVDNSAVLDLYSNGVTDVSAQVEISSDVLSAVSFDDGQQSTANLTINDFQSLIEKKSTGAFTVSSNTALAGSIATNQISIASNTWLRGSYASNTIIITEAGNNALSTNSWIYFHGTSYPANAVNSWYIGNSSIATAENIARFFNTGFSMTASTSSNGVVQFTMNYVGEKYNKYEMSSSTPAGIIVANSSFTGGRDRDYLTMNGVVFATDYTGDVNWSIADTSTGTATNLAKAMNHAVYGISASTTGTGSTVTLVSDYVGSWYNGYSLSSSSSTALIVKYSSFVGGSDPVYVSVNGIKLYNTYDWSTGTTSTATAKNISNAIMANSKLNTIVVSTWTINATSGVVNITAVSTGTDYNYSISSSSETLLATSSTSLLGGGENAILRIGKVVLKQGKQWYATVNSSTTAKSISDSIASDSYLSTVLRSTWVTGVQAYNTITITSMSAIENSTITLNGVKYREGIEWFILDSSMNTTIGISTTLASADSSIYISSAGVGGLDIILIKAKSYTALGNSYTLSSSTPTAMAVGSAYFVGGFTPAVFTTSVYTGTMYNFYLYSSTKSALTWSNIQSTPTLTYSTGNMTNGDNPSFSTYTSIINIVGHSLTTGSAVLLSTVSGTISPLVDQTTYYAIIIDTNNIKLATTANNAVAGTSITLTNIVSGVTKHTLVLTPLAVTGSAGLSWTVSNDSVTWYDAGVSSTSFLTPYTTTATFTNFGTLGYRYLKANIKAPSTGSVKVKVLINSK